MSRFYFVILTVLVCMCLKGIDINYGRAGTGMQAPAIEWQDVYVINNADVDIKIAANVTHFSTLIDLQKPQARIERITWFIPKKEGKYPSVSTMGKLNLLDHITVEVQVDDLSLMPAWAQKPYSIEITNRIPEKVLLITVNKASHGWKIQQDYVQAVKMVPGGPSGYHIDDTQF